MQNVLEKKYESGQMHERRCNMRQYTVRHDCLCNTITTVQKDNYILEIRKLRNINYEE